MKHQKQIAKQRERRCFRVRNRVRKSAAGRPRLSIFRSNKNIYAQIIDDEAGRTLIAASTAESSVCEAAKNRGNRAAAASVGKALAERAVTLGIKQVALDRGRYRYHGRVAALADAAREGGLEF